MTEDRSLWRKIVGEDDCGIPKHGLFECFFAFWIFSCFMLYVFCVTFMDLGDHGKDFALAAIGFILGNGFSLIFVWAFRTTKSAYDQKMAKLNKEG